MIKREYSLFIFGIKFDDSVGKITLMKSLLLSLTLIILSQFTFGQSKLGQAKDNLSSNDQYYSSSSSGGNSSDSDGSFLLELLIEPIVWIAVNTIIGEGEYRMINPSLYANNSNGEYILSDFNDQYKNSLFKGSLDYTNSKDAIQGVHLNVDYRFSHLFGAQFSHSHFYERYFGETEHLDMSSLLFNYYRIREKYITAWWGLGGSYIANGVNRFGFTYNIGAEIFPIRPFSFLFSWQQHFINNQHINTLKAQLKCHLKHFNVYLGYHNYNIANITNPSLAIGIGYRF